MRLRGSIDRVDVGEAGEAVVYDYKSSQAPAAARWIKDGNLQVALYMLAVEQLRGLRAVGGFYQPLSGEDLRARGVLDGDSGVEIACRADRPPGGLELRGAARRGGGQAREVADQAGRGELGARPATCAFKGGCRYPTICRCEW